MDKITLNELLILLGSNHLPSNYCTVDIGTSNLQVKYIDINRNPDFKRF